MSVRAVLQAVVVASTLVAGPLAAQTADVKMAIDWTFQGPAAMYLHALEQKWFEQENLRVTIDRGFGSADAVTKAASGAWQFTTGDINSMIEFNARNPDRPVVAVYMIYSKPPFAVVTLADRGIATPRDLEGRRVATNEGLAAGRIFPLFARGAGVDPAKIAWVNVAPPMLDTVVVQKNADAGLGFWTTQSLNMKAANVATPQVRRFLYADYGVALYGNALLTTKAYADANPDVVRRFVKVIARSYKAVIPDASAVMPALKRREPTTDEALELERLRLTVEDFVFTEEAKRVGLGGIDPARLERAIDQLDSVLKLPVKPRAADVFDDRFLPPLAERRF